MIIIDCTVLCEVQPSCWDELCLFHHSVYCFMTKQRIWRWDLECGRKWEKHEVALVTRKGSFTFVTEPQFVWQICCNVNRQVTLHLLLLLLLLLHPSLSWSSADSQTCSDLSSVMLLLWRNTEQHFFMLWAFTKAAENSVLTNFLFN